MAILTEDAAQARDEFYPYYKNYWTYVSKQRGTDFHMDREHFEQMTGPHTALFVGSPDAGRRENLATT